MKPTRKKSKTEEKLTIVLEIEKDVYIQKNVSWGLARITSVNPLTNSEFTYRFKRDTNPVIVYAINGGACFEHDQFQGRVVHGANFANNVNITDEDGHGTKVMSLIGGIECGVAKDVTIFSVKIGDNKDELSNNLLQGLDHVLLQQLENPNQKAILNLSYTPDEVYPLLDNALSHLATLMPVVISAGNDGKNVSEYFKNLGESIIVASSDINDNFSSYSNFGELVTIVAPGRDVRAASIDGKCEHIIDFGCSLSAAYTTGVLCKMWAANPLFNHSQLREFLISSSLKDVIKGDLKGTVNRLLHFDV